ncbi:hypothetical protein ACKU27_13630 [Sphingobium yanoikuyae]|uniref:hypothetical protein n=1 Tax=Sphingobium yanoikuyae TaxID=13690 RepID=UPI003B92021C
MAAPKSPQQAKAEVDALRGVYPTEVLTNERAAQVQSDELLIAGHSLTREQAQEVIVRLKNTDGPTSIGRSFGWSKDQARRICSKIAKAADLPSTSQRRSDLWQVILDKDAQGVAAADIAALIGRPAKYVTWVLWKLAPAPFLNPPMAPNEIAKMKLLATDGLNSTAIAREIGCSQVTAAKYTRDERRKVSRERANADPCQCGLSAGHKSACSKLSDADLEAMALAGVPTSKIADRIGIPKGTIRPRLARMRAKLIADEALCQCGLPISHSEACSLQLVPEFIDETKQQVAAMAIDGASADEICRKLNISIFTIRKFMKDAAKASASPSVRKAAAERSALTMMRRGDAVRTAARKTGLSRDVVKRVAEQAIAAGVKFQDCGCGRPWGHSGSCSARGQKSGKPSPKPARTAVSYSLSANQMQTVKKLFVRGYSAFSAADKAGAPIHIVKRLMKAWRASRPRNVKPCGCGRAKGHSGGCIINTPGVLGPRWLSRIREMVTQGFNHTEIAEAFRLNVDTVARYAAKARNDLPAGAKCDCGRLQGHAGVCSRNWERGERKRGVKPIEPTVVARIKTLLQNGEDVAAVAVRLNTSALQVERARASLADDQKARRRLALKMRQRAGDGFDRQLLTIITDAMPRHALPSIRAEAAAELCLAIIEGHASLHRLEATAKSFATQAVQRWESNFGPKSMDGTVSADIDRSLHDMVADETTASHIDELSIGELNS